VAFHPEADLNDGLKNLAQQMRITDAELRLRKELLGFTTEHAVALKGFGSAALMQADGLVAEFYRRQLSVPVIRTIIGDQDTLLRLSGAMRAYVIRMFEGHYDLNYAISRLRVGQVHARIGVAPKLYISSLHTLEELVEARIGGGPSEALRKLFLLDLQFAFDAYIHGLVGEVAQARDEIQRYSDTLEEVIRERTAEATRHAETDPLSGLRSRAGFDGLLRRHWEIAKATAVDLTVALFDLDGFKQINDSKGHLEGDRVIQVVGRVMASEKRASDFAFRIGGDEFCLILPMTNLQDAAGVCERLCGRIGAALGGEVTLSFGLASLRESGAEMPRELLGQADRELYRMKSRRVPRLLPADAAEPA
jgi:diguanylate cyclase (GGDEF)-like protein